jgi:hypothetical protein
VTVALAPGSTDKKDDQQVEDQKAKAVQSSD